jgi:predicted O-methyltransferase YrrM
MLDKIKLKLKIDYFRLYKQKKYAVLKALSPSVNVIHLSSYKELHKLFKWTKEPILDETQVHLYDHVLDVNQRRLRDAESIMTVCANIGSENKTILEIGTASGITTASMAVNAPEAQVYTINIPPEEAAKGEGGRLITGAFSKDIIGSYYREKKIKNITQIYANTLSWKPDIGMIDVAFIDGCHDYEFVINDTLKLLPYIKPNGFILWHDFNPDLALKYDWIGEVCMAVDWLQSNGYLPGEIYHIKDSWVGIYQKVI